MGHESRLKQAAARAPLTVATPQEVVDVFEQLDGMLKQLESTLAAASQIVTGMRGLFRAEIERQQADLREESRRQESRP